MNDKYRIDAKRTLARWSDDGPVPHDLVDAVAAYGRECAILAFERAKTVLGCDCEGGRKSMAVPVHHIICIKSMLDREISYISLPEWKTPTIKAEFICSNCDGAPDGGHTSDIYCIHYEDK